MTLKFLSHAAARRSAAHGARILITMESYIHFLKRISRYNSGAIHVAAVWLYNIALN